MIRRIGILGLVAIFLVVSYFLIRQSHGSSAYGQSRNHAAPLTTETVLKDLEGRDVSLAQFEGKVVLVNFWATWCGPCKTEIPWLIELQEKYHSRGFTVIGIAMDEEGKDAVAPFVNQNRFFYDRTPRTINYPIALGNDAIAEKFGGVIGFPTTVVIGKDGQKVKRVDGELSYEEMDKVIASLL
ncbi:MAG TPA: TlpA disulfide reductase family protein [Chthoniobacterales bacterium]|nr:TlpA disulfide reductase family protein [Chthoniobacterales bacterium]